MSEELFRTLKERFCALPEVRPLLEAEDPISVAPLSADAILGSAERKDFPILAGKEIIQQAAFRTGRGQAFTSLPSKEELTLPELLQLPLSDGKEQALFIAAINAVLHHMGLIRDTVHCRDDGPECCSLTAAAALTAEKGDARLALIGYQPCLFANLSTVFPRMRATDLSLDKIGRQSHGVTVEDAATATEAVCDWAELILCTGSTLTNGTFPYFYDLFKAGRDIRFYGTTIAGAAYLLGLKRLCHADLNGRPGALRRERRLRKASRQD